MEQQRTKYNEDIKKLLGDIKKQNEQFTEVWNAESGIDLRH